MPMANMPISRFTVGAMPKTAKRLQHHLGVGGAAKARRRAPSSSARNSSEIVDLAVERDDQAAVGRQHRLVPGRRQVEDGEAAVRQRDAGFGVAPDAVIVGAAMRQAVAHGLRAAFDLAGGAVGPQDACDAAHGDCLALACYFDNNG